MRHTIDRDLRLFHRFEERRLGFWGGPVDLVGQHHLGNDRPSPELEAPSLLIEDVYTGHIAGQQVWRELDPLEGAPDTPGHRLGEYRLPNAGYILNQDMPAAEQRDQNELDLAPLANDNTLNVVTRGLH
jgi:hypothetical protein